MNFVSVVCVCSRTGYGRLVILVNNILKTGKTELDYVPVIYVFI